MEPDTEKIIGEQLKTLPPKVRELIGTEAWSQTTSSIAGQYLLNAEQKEDLKTEVLLTIIGLEDPLDLIKNITDHVGVSPEEADQISTAISHRVLGPILDVWQEEKTVAAEAGEQIAVTTGKLEQIAEHSRFKIADLNRQFATLPKNIQAIIMGGEIGAAVGPLANKYDLRIDQAGILAEIVTLVMMGLIKTTEFIAEIENQVGLTKTRSADLAYEIDQKLFKPIRNDLRAATEAAKEQVIPPKPISVTPIAPEPHIIHPHPAQKAYYGSVPPQFTAPTQPTTQAPSQPTLPQNPTPKIDPYREPV